ncbi:MAG: Tat pathway signal protein [Bauldia litoralis]
MNRRQLLTIGAGLGGAAVAGGLGYAIWARHGASAWAAEVEAIRRPLTVGPGLERHRELVRYATLAANSHNTQPWRFAIAANSITVTPDRDRRCAVVDPDDHHLFASLGCAVENIVQAAPLVDLVATPRFDPAGSRIVIDLEPGGGPGGPGLAEAIPRRQCARSVYDGKSVAPADIAKLETAGQGDGVAPISITDRGAIDRIVAFIVDGNTQQIDDPAFAAELTRWIRFSYGEALSARDGLFAAVSGNPVLPGPIGKLIFPLVFSAKSENARIVEQVDSSAGLMVFVSETNDEASWIEAGRAYQRFALTATNLGIAHAFLNQPVEVAAVRRRFADHLDLGDRRPDFVVRFGYGPRMPMSLRRPVEAVLVEAG